MRYASIKKFDIANAPFVCTTLFVSGCTFNCVGCFNKEAQSFNYGNLWTNEVENDFISHSKNENIKGVCLLGGEVFQQSDEMLSLLKRLKNEVNKPIWCWTGYLYEKLAYSNKREWLEYIDVLIDGQFEIDKKDLKLKYRGSSNQRIIDVKESLKNNKTIEIKILK